MTEGLDKNRLAITSGFDKMDEVKKWDLQQLPGYEAIEEPEMEESKKFWKNLGFIGLQKMILICSMVGMKVILQKMEKNYLK